MHEIVNLKKENPQINRAATLVHAVLRRLKCLFDCSTAFAFFSCVGLTIYFRFYNYRMCVSMCFLNIEPFMDPAKYICIFNRMYACRNTESPNSRTVLMIRWFSIISCSLFFSENTFEHEVPRVSSILYQLSYILCQRRSELSCQCRW